ncbi:MAG: DUF5320 domain-containing protein [Candidatus Aminicenantes bacterium]|jgi:hypothetical protein|nr:DUF5320 domain-containing protein [Candidatus Aminicenantes bacterium]MDH5383876.1 DUF5320 domain-containing protein [Candidatus Aminicenantes bacterium]MDH5742346.1 DUF5320 domain-containing protein [Candidatus Aminicenantes bacterium]
MPFGMGRAGWYMWPHMAYWRMYGPPWSFPPYWSYSSFPSLEDEEQFLKDQASILEDQLAQINKRLAELKKQEKGKK